ncbi:MAG TPA: 2-oxo acid dehydrogenase subunit E2 [Roseiflexaceae bacterium]|nr:2-oxo acid dehydrogenase subunit E2 [Roseiflexaceae bacterium]
MSKKHIDHRSLPFPLERRITIDGGHLAAQRHTIHGLIEVDVTRPRQYIREHKARTGETLSFTAFVIACLGKAIDENKMMHAYRDWRNRLILFDEVDVNTMVEIERDGRNVVLPYFIRAANKRTFRDIHAELRTAQAQPEQSREFGVRQFAQLPRLARILFYWAIFKNPRWLKQRFCTVGMTSVGMFGSGSGWAIPFGVHTLDIALGGIAEKPGVINGRITIREYLCLTISFDHDIIDGAPAARFATRLSELIAGGFGLCEHGVSLGDQLQPYAKQQAQQPKEA